MTIRTDLMAEESKLLSLNTYTKATFCMENAMVGAGRLKKMGFTLANGKMINFTALDLRSGLIMNLTRATITWALSMPLESTHGQMVIAMKVNKNMGRYKAMELSHAQMVIFTQDLSKMTVSMVSALNKKMDSKEKLNTFRTRKLNMTLIKKRLKVIKEPLILGQQTQTKNLKRIKTALIAASDHKTNPLKKLKTKNYSFECTRSTTTSKQKSSYFSMVALSIC